MTDNNGKVRPFGIKDKLGYMFGDFGNDFTFLLSAMFLLKFYTDVMGVSAALVGLMMMAARFVDAITDVTMGQIVAGSDTCVLLTPGIHTREEPETGRSAGGGSCVSIRELHALSGQTVDIGCAHFGCSVAAQITDTKIVGEYVNNVRLLVVLSVTLLSGIITS